MPKHVSVELDKPRKLRFDINALSDAEEALGVGIGAILQQNLGIRTIRALLWAGLKWQDHGLTLQRAGTLLQKYIEDRGDLSVLEEKLVEALMGSGLFGELDDEEGNAKAEAAE